MCCLEHADLVYRAPSSHGSYAPKHCLVNHPRHLAMSQNPSPFFWPKAAMLVLHALKVDSFETSPCDKLNPGPHGSFRRVGTTTGAGGVLRGFLFCAPLQDPQSSETRWRFPVERGPATSASGGRQFRRAIALPNFGSTSVMSRCRFMIWGYLGPLPT